MDLEWATDAAVHVFVGVPVGAAVFAVAAWLAAASHFPSFRMRCNIFRAELQLDMPFGSKIFPNLSALLSVWLQSL